MADPIYHGSKPKIHITFSQFSGNKKISDEDVSVTIDLYVGKFDPSKVITLHKNDLTPVSGSDNEFVAVIDTSALSSGANLFSRLTVAYTDPDTGKTVQDVRVQDQGIRINAL